MRQQADQTAAPQQQRRDRKAITYDPYNLSTLHNFIDEVFPGAVKLEQHQVHRTYASIPTTAIHSSLILTLLHIHAIGCCDLPAACHYYILVISVPSVREQQEKT